MFVHIFNLFFPYAYLLNNKASVKTLERKKLTFYGNNVYNLLFLINSEIKLWSITASA